MGPSLVWSVAEVMSLPVATVPTSSLSRVTRSRDARRPARADARVVFRAAGISVSAAVVLVLATAAGLAGPARALTGPQHVTISAVKPSSSSAVVASTGDIPSQVGVHGWRGTPLGGWSATTPNSNASPRTTP